MAQRKKTQILACDFETTVYEGQERTDVWASAVVPVDAPDDESSVLIHHSIQETLEYFKSLKTNLVCYYHNLKFDGAFWVDYLLIGEGFSLALDTQSDISSTWKRNNEMPNNSLKCSVSAMGQWYTITFKIGKQIIELRDSYKLLPFKLKRIGESFKTKHRKLEMEYEGFRYPGCEISEEERKYIANDVLVQKEALQFMFSEGHDKLTIGACCLSEYVKLSGGKDEFEAKFPNIYEIPIDKNLYGSENAGEYVRKSYKGGWCYLVRGKENRILHSGMTADVNSLYPSMMSSESGNYYPTGTPTFVSMSGKPGASKPGTFLALCNTPWLYRFFRFKCRFYLKPGKLPFVQIKNSFRFRGNESLETSDYFDPKTGKYYTHYWFGESEDTLTLHSTAVELTMTQTDFVLFCDHYNIVDYEALDYCEFHAEIGLFDIYIEKYKEIKLRSTGAMRELAKLFLNNLYGKLAASTDSSFKVPFIKDDSTIGLYDVTENEKKPGYIPAGSAVTSYARNFTIRAAQLNYYGPDKPGFVYADTDSIHCDISPDQVRGITVHDKNFCCWKLESCWDRAIFSRQKTYIEHITHADLKPVEAPHYDIKCAGMPDGCKNIFKDALEYTDYLSTEPTQEEETKYLDNLSTKHTEEAMSIIRKKLTLEDFTVGLRLPGKLIPHRIKGGILLVNSYYEMLPGMPPNPKQKRKTKLDLYYERIEQINE